MTYSSSVQHIYSYNLLSEVNVMVYVTHVVGIIFFKSNFRFVVAYYIETFHIYAKTND